MDSMKVKQTGSPPPPPPSDRRTVSRRCGGRARVPGLRPHTLFMWYFYLLIYLFIHSKVGLPDVSVLVPAGVCLEEKVLTALLSAVAFTRLLG